MKKLLLIAASSALLFTSNAYGSEGQFYLKAAAGMNFMNKTKYDGIKLKTKIAPAFTLGAGYHILDNVRTDLTFELVANPQRKGNAKFPDVAADLVAVPPVAGYTNNTVSSKSKATVAALMVNAYVDVVDFGMCKIFTGAGVGFSRVKEKYSSIDTFTVTGAAAPTVEKLSTTTKSGTNFAWQATLGTSVEVASGVNLEASYNFSYYGKGRVYKVAPVAGAANDKFPKTVYKGSNVKFGVRFDL